MAEDKITKVVLGTPVVMEKTPSCRYWKISIDIPRYKGALHWLESDDKLARDIFDCINEDKVFMLQNAKHNFSMKRTHHLVGIAIVRRFGLPKQEKEIMHG